MMRRLTAILGAGALTVFVAGCFLLPGPEGVVLDVPQPVIELSGQALARRVERWEDLPAGEGTDGEPGDLLLENAFVRFVVGGASRRGPVDLAGNLVDAAVQNGEDELRLLAPAVGVDALLRPACTGVSIMSGGGMGEDAVVEARGYVRGAGHLQVMTRYRLEPDTSSLEIQTTVTNSGDEGISGLYIGDVLHQGRTICYAPDGGLMPVGGRTQSKWLAFLEGRHVWGLISTPLGRIDAKHFQGGLEARHAVDLLPAGETRRCRRYLAAEVGGTPRIAELAGLHMEPERSYLEVVVSDDEGEPVVGARVLVVPVGGGWPVLLVSGDAGRAALGLVAGKYSLTVWAPGRVPWGPAEIGALAGSSHRQTIVLSEAAHASVRVVGEIGEFRAPTAARVAVFRDPRDVLPFPAPMPFPAPGSSGVVCTLGHEGVTLPLPAVKSAATAAAHLSATRGPLFDVGSAAAEAAPGETAEAVLTIRRLVEPGEYAAVDCRRHTLAGTESPLTPPEQLLAGACEGLDAAVLASPQLEPVVLDGAETVECRPVNSLRIVRDGIGSFSVYPVDDRSCDPAMLRELVEADISARRLLSRLRELFPDALIQVDEPLHGARGYFTWAGFDVLKHARVPDGLSHDFDALEILSGDDVAGARRLLEHWFLLLNAGRRVFVTGSSGLRTLDLGATGATRTFVRCSPGAPERLLGEYGAVLQRLRERPDAFVTNGPFVEVTADRRPLGSTVGAEAGRIELQVRVSAPGWVDVSRVTVYCNGAVLHELAVPQAREVVRLDQKVSVDVSADCWLVVVVEGDKPMTPAYFAASGAPTPFAVTNPIWVDGDGDGRVEAVAPLGK
jgi:hypothetical protein